MAAALAMGVMLDGMLPRANQAYRVAVFQSVGGGVAPSPTPGANEMTFAELRAAESKAAISPGGTPHAQRLRGAHHRRYSLPVACLVLTWFGLSCSASGWTRSGLRRLGLMLSAVLAYYTVMLSSSGLVPRLPASGPDVEMAV